MKASKPTDVYDENAALVLRRFRVVFNSVRTHFRLMEKESGLGGAQVWALSLIQKKPRMGVGEISLNMDIHQSTASNLVKILLKKELITTSKAADDKRAVELRITAEGKKVLKKVPGPFEGVLPDAIARLDEKTIARLSRDLESLAKVLHADEDAGKIPLAHL